MTLVSRIHRHNVSVADLTRDPEWVKCQLVDAYECHMNGKKIAVVGLPPKGVWPKDDVVVLLDKDDTLAVVNYYAAVYRRNST